MLFFFLHCPRARSTNQTDLVQITTVPSWKQYGEGGEEQGCPLVCATKECCKFNWTTPKRNKKKIKISFKQQQQQKQQVSLELRHRQQRRRRPRWRRAALERRQITVSKAKRQRPKQWIENGRSSAAGSGSHKGKIQRERERVADRSKESMWWNAHVCSAAKFKWTEKNLSALKYSAVTVKLVIYWQSC